MGLRPDIPCKKHKNGSIELYATIANTKRGCAYFDTPSWHINAPSGAITL